MPGNTQNPTIPGTAVGFQNPSVPSLELDSEVVATDPVTGLQVTREYVVNENSISGQSDQDAVVPILAELLKEVQRIRTLLEAGAVPGTLDETADMGDQVESDSGDIESEET